jgi:transcriptional regulator with XRE-family HTH domain
LLNERESIISTTRHTSQQQGSDQLDPKAPEDDAATQPASSRSAARSEPSPADGIGERVAARRHASGIKVSELARLVGVSPSLISQIERGQSRPSVSTLFELAEALKVPVDTFFSRSSVEPPIDAASDIAADGAQESHEDADEADPVPGERRYLVRRDARSTIDIEGGVRWERLTPTTLDNVEFLELVYAPGAQSHETLYRHPGTEMVLVTSGQLDISVGFEQFRLHAGDSIQFPSSRPHRYVNTTREVARAVTVILHDEVDSSNQRQRRP